ncbi:hypothetical protein [Deinococcus hopiensis]|uniref:Uncharacterized protein n=1 Tax=Deinococcus hopiensis KR-140 TaxID=695939 RepID=A0A1W1VGD9_9DEIO|nr:hypothetical protein [Deinococcus hopiensis]SMB92469.1 hypothetical protein SAMN00790413_01581 [Deinococcus hopiensis KR-140]
MLTLQPSHGAERARQLRTEAQREREARAVGRAAKPTGSRLLRTLLSALHLAPPVQPA